MLLAAIILFTVAAAASWFGASRPQLLTRVAWLLCGATAVVLVAAGGLGLSGHRGRLGLGDLGGLGPASLHVDQLSGLFLVITFGVAVPVLLAGASASAWTRPRLPGVVALTLGAVEVILTADNLFVFLFGWEALTVAFYLLCGYDRAKPGRDRAAIVTVAFGKVSGAALLAGGLILVGQAHTFHITGLGMHATGAGTQIAYALLLFGFGVKVGLIPLQVWLPPGYASAPGAARPVMAGVAVNVGFYGMWRTLQVLGAPPIWLIVIVLLIAGISAILGIAHSAVHADLAYLVAWSSVENAGVISAGFGVALVGTAAHQPRLAAAGLLAATAQVCAHALGKSLLFVATAAIEEDTGTTDLDRLRGLVRTMPWAGVGLVVGSLTLAGLPLTAGFASEWLTLESLMQQFRVDNLAVQLSTAVAGALVALTVGVASVTFVRLVSFTAFGPSAVDRVAPVGNRADRAWTHRVAIGLLVGGCLGAAMFAPLEVRLIARGLSPLVGTSARTGLKQPWVLQPVFADFSALSPTWLWIVIPALVVIIGTVTFAFSGMRVLRVRRVPAWTSASPGVERGAGYTSFGYANPMRKVLANLLMTRGELRREEVRTGGQVGAEKEGSAGVRLGYTVDVIEVVEHYLYRPAWTALLAVVRLVKRLQSGRLDAYMMYMLIALVAVLAVVTATA